MNDSRHSKQSDRAKNLRKQSTKSERLLWGLLRGKQLCGLKFRRQHPIAPYFADFACVPEKLVVEIDGDYHDHVADYDIQREAYLMQQGWDVIRFSDQDVEEDVESVGVAIAKHLGLNFEFRGRVRRGSGMFADQANERGKTEKQ